MEQSSGDIQAFSLSGTIAFIDGLEKTVNDLRIHTRRSDMYPFDTVAGEMLSKAFALSRASILLVQNGYPDEAFGLCRSLYECSIYLRYITQQKEKRDERASKFLQFGVTSKAFWFDLLDKNSPLTQAEREDIERYKAENRIPDDPKRITQPWSEVRKLIEKVSKEQHPTDADDSTEAFRLKEKAISYTDTSSYVHCTQPGLNAYTFEWKEPIIVRRSRSVKPNTALKVCMVIQVHLRAVARYCLFGMEVVSLAELKRREHAAADILGTAGEEH
jgi:hypothetical protein